MRKILVVLALLALAAPLCYADVNIGLGKKAYSLGERLDFSISAMLDKDYVNAFVRTDLICTSESMELFSFTKSFEGNFRENLNYGDIFAGKNMVGTCVINVIFKDAAKNILFEKQSEAFTVNKHLTISCDDAEALPGKKMEIACSIAKASGKPLEKGTASFSYRTEDYKTDINNGVAIFNFDLKNDTPSGVQIAAVKAQDSYGNYMDHLINFKVNPIPSKIAVLSGKPAYFPFEPLELKPMVYDHLGEPVSVEINAVLYGQDGKVVTQKLMNSSKPFEYTVNSLNPPGKYKVVFEYKDMAQDATFDVLELKNVDMTYTGQKIIITNIGNVKYIEETAIVAEEEGKRQVINNEIKLLPGETAYIDLSKELAYGFYDIYESEAATQALAKSAEINDNRPAYKKVGLNMITGAAVKTVEYATSKPLYTGIILGAIVAGILLFYSRGIISRAANRVKVSKRNGVHIAKKDYADIEGLFDDVNEKK